MLNVPCSSTNMSLRAPPAEKAVVGSAEKGQAAPGGAPSSKKVGSMVMMLGRVRFENLEEKEVLGQGTFGVVLAGTYDGREVAIKRARGCLGSTQIMEAFRCGPGRKPMSLLRRGAWVCSWKCRFLEYLRC